MWGESVSGVRRKWSVSREWSVSGETVDCESGERVG